MSVPVCPYHFVQYHFVRIPFCPYHYVRTILSATILSGRLCMPSRTLGKRCSVMVLSSWSVGQFPRTILPGQFPLPFWLGHFSPGQFPRHIYVLCIHTCTCMHTHINIHTHIHTHIYVHTYYIHTYTHIHTYVYVSVYIGMCTRVYFCMYMYVYVYVRMHN